MNLTTGFSMNNKLSKSRKQPQISDSSYILFDLWSSQACRQRECIRRSGGQEGLVMRSMPRPTTAPIPLPKYTPEVKYFISPRNTTMQYTQCWRLACGQLFIVIDRFHFSAAKHQGLACSFLLSLSVSPTYLRWFALEKVAC